MKSSDVLGKDEVLVKRMVWLSLRWYQSQATKNRGLGGFHLFRGNGRCILMTGSGSQWQYLEQGRHRMRCMIQRSSFDLRFDKSASSCELEQYGRPFS